MDLELRALTANDGMDVYEMLQEIPKDENGFMNGANGLTPAEYIQWLARAAEVARGEGLEDWMVPQSTYWLYADGRPVGVGKVRHRLTEKLLADGGHIGYAIRPDSRGMGYGKAQLKQLLAEAKKLGIGKILLTIRNYNTPSLKVALTCGGVIEKVTEEKHYIWI